MREILFRGQTRKLGEKVRIGDGAPVPGHFGYSAESCRGRVTTRSSTRLMRMAASMTSIQYTPTPWGQYIGKTDKNGKMVFDGDILAGHYDEKHPEDTVISVVTWGNTGWCLKEIGFVGVTELDDFFLKYNEVIGNIHDNPELLEVAGNDA